jgi:hypothetical protein
MGTGTGYSISIALLQFDGMYETEWKKEVKSLAHYYVHSGTRQRWSLFPKHCGTLGQSTVFCSTYASSKNIKKCTVYIRT